MLSFEYTSATCTKTGTALMNLLCRYLRDVDWLTYGHLMNLHLL
jgi:hypothetical protein